MNVFATDSDPVISAQNLDDKRLVKMVTETAQILSTALFRLGYWRSNLYQPTHNNHPVVVWAKSARGNFNWLVLHGLALGAEYRHRYGTSGDHRAVAVILNCAERFKDCPMDIPGMTPWSNCTTISAKNVISAYRKYLTEKWDNSEPRWTNRDKPEWYKTKRRNGSRT